MKNQLLSILLEEFRHKIISLDDLWTRALQFPELPNKILAVIGVRRSGKTNSLLAHIKKLLAEGIPLSRILYLNFEDDRLLPADGKMLAHWVEDFYELYPENHDQLCYLFFDEIQNIDNWATVIRRFFDTKKVKIILTGYSAKLLSKEISTSLRGRSYSFEIWPFSFDEFLMSQKIEVTNNLFGKIIQDKLQKQLLIYLNQGGFPEVINVSHEQRQHILQEYVNIMMFRDIIERHQINNLALIKYLISYILKNTATSFSINKFFNDIKSQGIAVSKNTLYHYLDYIEDAYIAFTVSLYSESIRKTHTNPRKIYVIDTGLVNAHLFRPQQNLGRLFETLIYLDLRRRGDEIYYYLTQDRFEIDFFTKSRDGQLHLYQVVWDDESPATLAREKRALEQAEQELNLKGKIITSASYLQEGLG